jgi:hypothetical protein
MAEIDQQKSAIGNAELAQRFVQFVMMQTQNIFYVLGRLPSPDGRAIPPNLEAGKLLIDQLEMIQEKTRNNVSAQEIAILDDALKNARLAFVEVSGGTPASMMPKPNVPEYPLEDEEGDFAPPTETAPAPAKAKTEAAPVETKPVEPAENKKKFTKTYG